MNNDQYKFRLCENHSKTEYIKSESRFFCAEICPYGNQILIVAGVERLTVCRTNLMISRLEDPNFDEEIA